MKLSQKQKLILAIVIFMITGFVLYNTFKQDSGDVGTTIGQLDTGGSTATEFNQNQDVIDLAKEFELVSINIGVFNSPLFLKLRDIDTSLIPENSGRSNPFSPVGTDSSVFKTQTQVQAQTQTSQKNSTTPLGPRGTSEI